MVIHQFNRLIKNKWIWGVFAVAISVFFAFDFLFTGRDDGPSAGAAGALGGKDVPLAKFRSVADEVRGFGRARDNSTPAAEINRRTWETLAALDVADKMKMTATDAEVREAILHDRAFTENGAFNRARYELLLRENGLTPEIFEDSVRRSVTLNKLRAVLNGGAAWVSPMELDEAINDWTDKYTVRVAAFADKDAAKVTVDDAAIEAYYKDNTNSIALPDCVKVKYIRLQADTPERLAQFAVTDDELHDRYDATSARFETTGTNGVTVTKTFEEVKPILEKELQLIASLEAYRTNLLFRVYPPDAPVDAKADRLADIAAAEKQDVKTSPLFSPAGHGSIPGFMSRPSVFAPDCPGFTETAAELDPDSADLKYGVVAGTNAVYLMEIAETVKARVPSFAEAKEVMRPRALADARAKAFKASVEKTRALAAAELAKGKPFDAKILAGATVSTSMTFTVSNLARDAFPDAMAIASATMKLAKGQISDFIATANPARALLVYAEDRVPGDAATAQMVKMQLRDDLARLAAASLEDDWRKWNLARLGLQAGAAASVETQDSEDDDGSLSED